MRSLSPTRDGSLRKALSCSDYPALCLEDFSLHQAALGSINSGELLRTEFTRVLTRCATMRPDGYGVSTARASSGVPVIHVSRSSARRIAGMRCGLFPVL